MATRKKKATTPLPSPAVSVVKTKAVRLENTHNKKVAEQRDADEKRIAKHRKK